MLDGYIIEELRRREAERQRQERQQPQLDLPLRRDEGDRERRSDGEEPSETGGSVVTIDL
ncbi:MAG: hypothetical protein INH41_29110 [Myxococcaceae bacterium]|jgi:hypothetical protein|nr:hypothetical protein [Myxococcaceae bacterium]MCA3016462.1 hypothetical protein [Myxococcaceae bacterium]